MDPMELIPKEAKEFASKEYWDKFFKNRDSSFEWYGDYITLKPVLLRYMKNEERLLIVGCGNSSLSADLYDDGYQNNVSIDISEVVVRKMNARYKDQLIRPSLIFECMDVFNMTYESESFNVVLDKGTLDALSSESSGQATKMFSEIGRVLKPFGRYVCISLLQEDILHELLSWFTKSNDWIIRIHRIPKETERETNGVHFPVFLVVCTKLKAPLPKLLIEVGYGEDIDFKKYESVSKVKHLIKSKQDFEFAKYFIRNNQLEENFYIQLYSETLPTDYRFRLYFAQKPRIARAKCAVFIVPLGREHEWLYSTGKGRQNLLKQCKFDRLIVVHLNRKHTYLQMEQMQDELAGELTDFIPPDADPNVTFLSIGDYIGDRKTIWSGKSEFSGEMVVEDVTEGKVSYRRLIFLDNYSIIQSEAKLKTIMNKKKKPQVVIDHRYLSCEHHQVILSGLSLIPKKNSYNLVLVGLGGGCLINFLIHNLQSDVSLRVVIVDIDPVMYDVAKRFFEFEQLTRPNITIEVVIQDGLQFIHKKCNNEQFDFIIFDVDCKNANLGISCPPQEFVEELFLSQVYSCLEPQGVFILNLVARNEDLKQVVCQRLKKQFAKCLKYKVEDDLNEIIFCFNTDELPWLKLINSQKRHSFLLKSCFHIDFLNETYHNMCKRKPLFL